MNVPEYHQMVVELVIELEDEYQRLKRLSEETENVSLVNLELARRRAKVARNALYGRSSKD
jgi:hypothetical protein